MLKNIRKARCCDYSKKKGYLQYKILDIHKSRSRTEVEPTFLRILRHVDQTLTSVGNNLPRKISYRSLRGLLCIRVFEARFHAQFLNSNVDSRKNETENQCCVTDREKLQTYRGLVTQLIRQPISRCFKWFQKNL